MGRSYDSYVRAWRRRAAVQRMRRERGHRKAWAEALRLAKWLRRTYRVDRVAVTGSVLDRERFRPGSDLDLIVWGLPKGRYLEALARLAERTAFQVDLVPWPYATPIFKRLVSQRMVVLYEAAPHESGSARQASGARGDFLQKIRPGTRGWLSAFRCGLPLATSVRRP